MTGTTPAIHTLLQIMRDADVFTRRRIEAADALLGFEAPPEAVGRAREYLVAVFEDSEQEIADRMDALKLARKFEAAKVTPRTAHTTRLETDRTEAWRRYEMSQRRYKIVLAIRNVPPPGWDDDLRAGSYVPPAEGWPGEPPDIPLRDLVVARKARADRMEQERLASPEATPEEKQAIRASISRRKGNGNGQGD